MIKICVVGGGIKGCSISALLAQQNDIQVVLVEKNIPAAGSTSTNHGRLHLGTSSWRSDSPSLVRRRLAGSRVMRSISNIKDNSKKAVYAFFSQNEAMKFADFCSSNSIEFKRKNCKYQELDLLEKDDLVSTFELSEYGFNPASLCSRLLSFIAHKKGEIVRNTTVISVAKSPNGLLVELSNKKVLNVDIVINAAGRWCNQIHPLFPTYDIEWFEWRILCCENDHLPIGNRVVAAMDESNGDPTLVPHGRWLTIDCKTNLIQKTSPNIDSRKNLRLVNMDIVEDSQLVNPISKRFPFILEKLRDNNIYSYAGIHGRIKNSTPGSINQIEEHPHIENYWLAFGGQATTAVLDAADSINAILDSYDVEISLNQLYGNLGMSGYIHTTKMKWETNP